MASLSITGSIDRTKFARAADGLMVAVAVSLPWSTSATGILLVLWLLALIPALNWADVRRELLTPAGGLPVLLFLLGLVGMAWSDVSLIERWKGLDGFSKLLVIPLLMTQFRYSENGKRVFIGFLIACAGLLIASWVVAVWPEVPRGSIDYGVAVKSYIAQSAEFAMCAAVLLYLAVEAARVGRWANGIALLVLAIAFLSDIFFITTSKTTLVIIPALALLYCARKFGWKGLFAATVAGILLGTSLWVASPHLRASIVNIFFEAEHTEAENTWTSTGERIVFWTKSLRFIESAPIAGHGTGSITELFRRASSETFWGAGPMKKEVSTNPHNQTFAIAIQLGLIGAAVLWAMWIFHFLLFRDDGLIAWIGGVIVVQNVVGSLFNSFLFDYTEGWIYVIGFGVAAGILRRQFDAARAIAAGGGIAV